MSKYLQQQANCAGNGCPNKGTFQLTIIYLNRKGWFCNNCKQDLTREGLVTENIGSGPRKAPEPAIGQAQSQQGVNQHDYNRPIR
jgi:hypothetical protein